MIKKLLNKIKKYNKEHNDKGIIEATNKNQLIFQCIEL